MAAKPSGPCFWTEWSQFNKRLQSWGIHPPFLPTVPWTLARPQSWSGGSGLKTQFPRGRGWEGGVFGGRGWHLGPQFPISGVEVGLMCSLISLLCLLFQLVLQPEGKEGVLIYGPL